MFHTTLTHPQQTPPLNFTFHQTFKIPNQLQKSPVHLLQPPFPPSSTATFKSLQPIPKTFTTTPLSPLPTSKKSHIHPLYQPTKQPIKPQLHLFIPTSPIHLQHKLKITQHQLLTSIKQHLSYPKQFFQLLQFSPHHPTTTQIPFLIQSLQTAINAAATIIN
ncbi:beta/alpha barrel domain-containing protein, partial [Staphylococcus epidermidis]